MRNVWRRSGAGLAFALLISSDGPVRADETNAVGAARALKSLQLEDLLNVQVFSASRKQERASEAPAAIAVLTGEEVRRIGVTSIPEALRYVPGMHVARQDNNDWAISARGFTSTTANKLQVLIDGRSVYTPLFSGVFWDVQDTLLEDLDRIEVIRGPGATLWGANAVNGVINVVTKSAKETQGTLTTFGGGTEEKVFGAVRHGGRVGSNSWFRVYAKGFVRDSMALPDGDSSREEWQQGQAGFRTDWEISDVTTLTLQGDAYAGRVGETRTVLSPTAPFVEQSYARTDVKGANVLGRWRRELGDSSDLILQTYYDRTHRSIPNVFGENRDTFDVDFQHRFNFAERHDLVWGVGYNVTVDEVENSYTVLWDPTSHDVHLFSGFVQDEVELVEDRLRLTIGTKLEHNSYSGVEFQPTLRLAWLLNTNQTVWGAVSRAVRTPSRLDADARLRGPASIGAPGSYTEFRGTDRFDPEELLALEVGYRVQALRRLSIDVAAYYHIYDNLRSLEIGATESSGGVSVFPIIIGNLLRGKTYGGEASVQLNVREWWRWHAGYTLLLSDLDLDPDSTSPFGPEAEGNSPTHQFFVRSSLDLPGRFEFDAGLRYVDDLPSPSVPSYLVMDLRLGWNASRNLELAIVALNLLDNQHPEFGAPGPARREVEHSVYGKVTWKF